MLPILIALGLAGQQPRAVDLIVNSERLGRTKKYGAPRPALRPLAPGELARLSDVPKRCGDLLRGRRPRPRRDPQVAGPARPARPADPASAPGHLALDGRSQDPLADQRRALHDAWRDARLPRLRDPAPPRPRQGPPRDDRRAVGRLRRPASKRARPSSCVLPTTIWVRSSAPSSPPAATRPKPQPTPCWRSSSSASTSPSPRRTSRGSSRRKSKAAAPDRAISSISV